MILQFFMREVGHRCPIFLGHLDLDLDKCKNDNTMIIELVNPRFQNSTNTANISFLSQGSTGISYTV